MAHQRFQKREFLGRQLDALASAHRLARAQVELQVPDAQRVGFAIAHRRAPSKCAYARREFHRGERLHQVIVGARAQPRDAVGKAVARGEDVLVRSERMTRLRLPTSVDLISTDLLQARSSGAAIVDEAIEQNADLILMATAITIKYGKQVIGEAASYVIKNAPCDVILIRSASDLHMQEALEG